jgi:hypothetical protein
LLIPQVAISIKRFMLPFLPVPQVAALVGHVNDAPFSLGGYTFATGTLLFVGGPSSLQADTLGNILYEVEYRMVFRYQPWNFFLHPNGTTGWAVVNDGNGNPVFPSGDFTTLP